MFSKSNRRLFLCLRSLFSTLVRLGELSKFLQTLDCVLHNFLEFSHARDKCKASLPITLFIDIPQSLLSTTSFGVCCNYLARYEEQGVGAQWSNFFSSPVSGDGFSLGYAICMMMIDAIIYGILTWYIEAVLPGEWCFLIICID